MKDFDLRKYLSKNPLLKEHSEVEMWDNMSEEERLYSLLDVVSDPEEAESYVDLSFHDLPDHVEAHVLGNIDEVFDPEGDYDIQYEIEDYERGDKVVVLPSLSFDPLDKQGETGEVFDIDTFEKYIIVKFDDGQIGEYPVGYVVFPGDENYIHPEGEVELDSDLFDPSTEKGEKVEDYYQSIKKGRKDWN